ncbi:nuclear transport factor 2 family protein [Actinocorallia populi]|uniref:nuclear transport factor 2 family protein n=1 Tax=Actinocorallia populi TaxID=2079200 RepID=UPI000D08AF5E|nr:nuclear transport factor 2 family protein [Actinocorallia populi]
MTGTSAAASLAEMLDERRHLLEIATWMFSEATADGIVHETYRRWYALDEAERADIAVPRAWLTRVAGGICLELLASTTAAGAKEPGSPARRTGPAREPRPRREPDPVAAWLENDPRPDHADPALLARHDHVVHRFAAACRTGDPAALKAVLAPAAIVVSDGGGKVRAATEPTEGADAVARFVTDLLAGEQAPALTVEPVNGRAGLLLRSEDQVAAVVDMSVADGRATALWIVLNPDKLRRWQPGAGGVPGPRTPHRPPAAPERKAEP